MPVSPRPGLALASLQRDGRARTHACKAFFFCYAHTQATEGFLNKPDRKLNSSDEQWFGGTERAEALVDSDVSAQRERGASHVQPLPNLPAHPVNSRLLPQPLPLLLIFLLFAPLCLRLTHILKPRLKSSCSRLSGGGNYRLTRDTGCCCCVSFSQFFFLFFNNGYSR